MSDQARLNPRLGLAVTVKKAPLPIPFRDAVAPFLFSCIYLAAANS